MSTASADPRRRSISPSTRCWRRAESAFRHRMSLSRDLMPRVETVIVQAGAGWEAIEAVAVGLGPGSYTGLRIGVVTAKALSWASGRPVLGISSLAALVAPQLAPP